MTDRRRAVAVVVLASLLQLAIAANVPLDPDETYYWDWSRHLAWGYVDHPPMIALLIKAGVILFGVTAVGVRLFSLLANLGAALLVVAIARRHGSDRAALRAACIVSAMPMLTTWLLLATPDPAYYFFSMAVLYAVDRALELPVRSTGSFRWWIIAGLCLGFAFASKYIAVLIPLGILVACLTHPKLRMRFAEPGPYVACLIAALIFVPVLLWNSRHGWMSFRFQLQHGLGASGRGSVSSRVFEYLGQEAGLATPVLFVMMGIAAITTLRTRADARRHMLATTAALTFTWFLVSALRQPVEGNWPLMAYPAAAIVLALAPMSRIGAGAFRAGMVIGCAMVAIVYAHTLTPLLPFPPANDPVRRGHGWTYVAAGVEAARHPEGSGRTWIAGNRYQDASELAYHLAGHPAVLSLNLGSRANEYDLWPTFAAQAASCDNLLVVLDDTRENGIAHALSSHFEYVAEGELVTRPELAPKRIWRFTCWQRTWEK